jgi:hypothetical protein
MASPSTFDIHSRYGTAALVRFTGLVALFLALYLVRLPLLAVLRLLEMAMRRVDTALTTRVSNPPPPRGARSSGTASTA